MRATAEKPEEIRYHSHQYDAPATPADNDDMPACDWPGLEKQLLMQWEKLTKSELDAVGPNRHHIALLVQNKYGISAAMVENYLANLARTLPTQGTPRI